MKGEKSLHVEKGMRKDLEASRSQSEQSREVGKHKLYPRTTHRPSSPEGRGEERSRAESWLNPEWAALNRAIIYG